MAALTRTHPAALCALPRSLSLPPSALPLDKLAREQLPRPPLRRWALAASAPIAPLLLTALPSVECSPSPWVSVVTGPLTGAAWLATANVHAADASTRRCAISARRSSARSASRFGSSSSCCISTRQWNTRVETRKGTAPRVSRRAVVRAALACPASRANPSHVRPSVFPVCAQFDIGDHGATRRADQSAIARSRTRLVRGEQAHRAHRAATARGTQDSDSGKISWTLPDRPPFSRCLSLRAGFRRSASRS